MIDKKVDSLMELVPRTGTFMAPPHCAVIPLKWHQKVRRWIAGRIYHEDAPGPRPIKIKFTGKHFTDEMRQEIEAHLERRMQGASLDSEGEEQ